MILTVLVLGGTILGATTIAGLLMLYQIRQTTDIANSTKAIYAADSGIEWGLYSGFCSEEGSGRCSEPAPVFQNGAEVAITCRDDGGQIIECGTTSTVQVRSVGKAGNSSRAFLLRF